MEMEFEMRTPQELKRELAQDLSCLLSSMAVYKFLAQGYHWNVRGADFNEYHEFFATLYEDAESTIDLVAESIRKVGYNAPFLLEDFLALSCLEVKPAGTDPASMSASLYYAHLDLKSALYKTFKCANEANEQGVADFIAGRIDTNDKWLWMLGAIIGADSTQIG
jgi:starvation-inducible DNA-binding protein